ncbi:MAG TPA: GntR family transcriptional regulator [Acidimicrobiales bacterium]|nr:GntR family transcriptional regulator [Acidimicrobiales bacterium]
MSISEGSLSDTVYGILRSRITKLEISPGQVLIEAQLASELGLSKTPVREALSRLRHEGFVVHDTNSSHRAAPVTIKDTRDLFAMRVLLEGEAAALAANQANEANDLRELEDLQASRYDTSLPESVDAFLEANTRFHTLVGRASGNERLAAALELTLIQMERLFRVGLLLSSRAEEIVHEHTDLVRAIVEGDPQRSRNAATRQGRRSQRMVIDALLSREEIRGIPLRIPPAHARREQLGRTAG